MYYLLLFVSLFLFECVYFKLADKFNIIDKPNERSSHTQITLRGGGILFYIGVLLCFLTLDYTYPWFMLGLTLLSVISFIDDVRPVPNKIRLGIHFVAVFFLCWQLGIVEHGSWWLVTLAIIVCTGVINAYNFMDGINGLTGGYSLVVLSVLAYVNETIVSFVRPEWLGVTILGVIVFCFFNFRTKAKCFAGDVGAVSIAFIIMYFLGRLILHTGDFGFVVLLVVYGVDAILTIIHRIILHENLGKAHRKHLYQLMANELQIPHLLVSAFYMALQAVIAIGYLWARSISSVWGWWYFGIITALLCGGYCLFMKKYFHLHS
ncbi:UDP-GlcNAc--UDP-phosphate GlcNAc-1-phosphate transferase [Bacteroidia bacterium]|nr:UDP-GlcNAc--UDP-phosphate GlcNAc-1-phosphate transferase [Bacteroidia bacterium]